MSSGAQESTIKIARSSDYVRSCYVSTPGGGSMVPANMASIRNHCRNNSGFHHRLESLHIFSECRKMVRTLTERWVYA